MHNFIVIAERNFKKAEKAYEVNRKKKNITPVELQNLLEKMEYERVVHRFMIQNYGGK